MPSQFEALIIGGGPAGLSAALSLGRMGRSALIVDDDRPRNRPSAHMNNFPGHDGASPVEWRAAVRKDLEKYPTIRWLSDTILSIKKVENLFLAESRSGKQISARKIILAYGVVDSLTEIKGHAELWGKSVFHCPYCHGYENRGKRLGLVANNAMAEHMFPMIYGLSKDAILFTHGTYDFSQSFREKLWNQSIRIVEERIVGLRHEGEQLTAVELEGGELIARDGLFWTPTLPFKMKSDLGEKLGCERTDFGFYKVDDFCKTTIEGVFAAGDITTMRHAVLSAASAGQIAGAAATGELLQEDFSKGPA